VLRRRSKAFFIAAALLAFFGLGASSLADSSPSVTIDPPAGVAYTTAEVSGTVNPHGGPSNTRYFFETATEPADPGSWTFASGTYGELSGAEAEGTTPIPVERTISGLQPNTEYAIRFVAENDGGRAETEAPYPTFETEAVSPPSVSIDPPATVSAMTADLSGSINPEAPAGNPSAFDVSWHFECTPGCSSNGGTVPADSSSHPIQETLANLDPNTEYEVTLVGSNAGGSVSDGPVSFTTDAAPPRVQTLYAGEVGEAGATLAARVNPRNSATTYQFEWGTGSGYGNVAPASPQALGATDNQFHTVTAPLGGLVAGSTYHFRIVVTNTETAETTVGEDHAFATAEAAGSQPPCPNAEVRTGASAELSSCRAYEQVSPRDKEYGVFNGEPFFALAAEEGGAAAFTANGPLPGSESGSTQNVYLSQRGATSWKLTALTPPQTPIPGHTTFPYTQGFSRNLLRDAILTANPTLAPGADPDLANLYVRETGPESWRLLTTTQTPENIRWAIAFDGASDDFSHVVFDSAEPLLPGVANTAIYENFGGELRLVGVLPNGEPASQSVFVAQTSNRGYNGVSADGSRVYFLSEGQIYVREDAARTLDVSASQRSEPDPNYSTSLFWAATRDGGTAFFTSNGALTDDANTGTDSEGHPTDAGANLYAYEVETESLSDLTVDTNSADTGGAGVLGVVGASDDGSYVYYVARGALAGDAISGEPNLYLWHDGETRFIASLSESDSGNWAAFLPEITSRVTPDGRHVLLSSSARLTSYDNTDAATEIPDKELYIYSAETDALSCVSCRPDGSRPTGSTSIKPPAGILNITRPFNRYVTDDGSTVAFDTTEPLVPRDNNGKRDVYEFAGGKSHLLSSGSSEFEAIFGDMSADGTDVFFGTRTQLTNTDSDLFADLYDARVGGGYATPPPPLPPCAGGECPRNSSNPPETSAIGTSTFAGKGNVRQQRRCRKGTHRVRRHGKARCVKKQKQGHHGHRRGAGSNKGGSK
jgi:hypothetical protein